MDRRGWGGGGAGGGRRGGGGRVVVVVGCWGGVGGGGGSAGHGAQLANSIWMRSSIAPRDSSQNPERAVWCISI